MEKEISYKLKRSKRAKRMRLAVYCDGSVVITSPIGVEKSIVEKFFIDKKRWIRDKLSYFRSVNSKAIRTFSHKDYVENKDKALTLVSERVRFYNMVYGFSYNNINIKNQRTRWGSCSKKRNLNFSYKILFLPTNLQDYIVVHELCHLKEFNHSRKFWLLVKETIPDYSDIRNELRRQEIMYK
jgi:predicted metal-dependent hydrolase